MVLQWLKYDNLERGNDTPANGKMLGGSFAAAFCALAYSYYAERAFENDVTSALLPILKAESDPAMLIGEDFTFQIGNKDYKATFENITRTYSANADGNSDCATISFETKPAIEFCWAREM